LSGRFAGPRTVLEIDLTTRRSRRYDLDDADFADALGGVGIAVLLLERYLATRELTRVDPLGPHNPLVFAAGPFAATAVPAANKHALATLSPLTGLLNEGLSSSHWSAALRRCGLAALLIEGTAEGWTTVVLDGERVVFEDAAALIGTTARETTKALRAAWNERALRVCAIGIGGENGVRYAAVENDGRQAGRGGSGAVMGAKRLKAIALRAHGSVRIADPAAAAEFAATLKARTLGPQTAKYRILGTGANMRVLERMGQLPTRNFTASSFAGVESVTPERARETKAEYVELRSGCAGCPVQCEHMYVKRGRDRKSAAASEYESVWAFGPNCGIADLDAVLDAIDRCDRYGLDTISTGGTLAFAMECAQHGLLDRDAFGTPLEFGNGRVLGPAIDAIARRTGPGELLALGVRAAAAAIGGSAPRYALHVKGLELPGYEPRALPTYALGLAVCTRGACHNRAATYDADLRAPGTVRGEAERVRMTIEAEDYALIWDSLVLCKFIRDCFVDFYAEAAALWTAVTGLTLDAGKLRASAQRTWERKRRINARQGWTAADDILPRRLLTPLTDGPYAGSAVDAAELARACASYSAARADLANAAR
jgi:aldehyde:ferredoxin oxidoreductase